MRFASDANRFNERGGESAGNPNLSQEQLQTVLQSAEDWLGVPYRYGGNSRSGIDCSALMMNVFSDAGIRLPRTSRQQFAFGSRIRTSQLAPGDLVFFNTSGKGVSHVGLYIGSKDFIHASSSRGVVRESMENSYYVARYIGARRVAPKQLTKE